MVAGYVHSGSAAAQPHQRSPGDALNRLTEVARGPPGAAQVLGQYGYNTDDRRVRVRESDRNADAWYDGLSLLVERVEQGGSVGGWWDTVRYHHDVGGLHAFTAGHRPQAPPRAW